MLHKMRAKAYLVPGNDRIIAIADINIDNSVTIRDCRLVKNANGESTVELPKIKSKAVNNPLCKKGCNKCCEGTFSISQSEFFMILHSLKITNEIQTYRVKAEEILKEKYELPERCIFVDDYTGACRIYEVRPLICRLYGVVNIDGYVCDLIEKDKSVYDKLLPSSNVNIAHNTFSFDNGIMTTPKPLIYWISKLTNNGELNTEKQKQLYEAAKHFSINEYLRILQI